MGFKVSLVGKVEFSRSLLRGRTLRRARWRRTCSRVRPGRRLDRSRAASSGCSTRPGPAAARAAAPREECTAEKAVRESRISSRKDIQVKTKEAA